MISSFLTLLLAHLFADFLFQTNAMVRRKTEIPVFALHILIVFALTLLALGGSWPAALAAAAAHLVIDAVKTWGIPKSHRTQLPAFLIDQATHVVSLIAIVLWWPDAFALANETKFLTEIELMKRFAG